jgi:hypothetical protein
MNFQKAKLISDIIWVDGPLLSLYEKDENKYLVKWADVGADHKWLIIEVSDAVLKAYYDMNISLLDVIEKSPAIYRASGNFIDDGIDCKKVTMKGLPKGYLPTEESFYKKELAPS